MGGVRSMNRELFQRGSRRSLLLAAFFVLSLTLIYLFLGRQELLYDTDAYYHLAVARATAEEGVLDQLPWVRYSIMRDGFGDKELLFHLLLAPFASLDDPMKGGRLALATLNALLLTTLAALCMRTLGVWGLLCPFWLVFVSTELSWRLVRLRPELLSLLLILFALTAMAHRRYRLLGFIVAVYTLSYTAFQALLGLCVLHFLHQGWARRRWSWPLLLYPSLGAGIALLLHPNFPHNLEVWTLQNFAFFALKGQLDVGTEARPNFSDVVLMANLGWYLGLAALWRSTPPAEIRAGDRCGGLEEALADAFGLAAAVFALLYLLMSRFSTYFIPITTLWLLFELSRRGRQPGARVRLPWRGRLPLWLAIGLTLVVSLPEALRQLRNYDLRNHAGPRLERLADREQLGRAIPPGARVAAPWGSTAIYMLWAPQGRYLNVLDPVFMAVPFPEEHATWQRILSATEPDIPLALASRLESDYLAFSAVENPELVARVSGDPRFESLHRDINALFRVLPSRNRDFLLDWRLVPPSTPLQAAVDGPLTTWRRYPRLPDAGRWLEGFVDLRRLGAVQGCVALAYDGDLGVLEGVEALELSARGPSTLWLGDELRVELPGDRLAAPGRGARLAIPPDLPNRRLTVSSCVPESGVGGFFLRALRQQPSAGDQG